MDKTIEARMEAIILARGMALVDRDSQVSSHLGIPYVNRNKVIDRLQEREIDFDVVSINFRFNDGLYRDLAMKVRSEGEIVNKTIRRVDGESIAEISFSTGFYGQVHKLRDKIVPSLLDPWSRGLFETDEALLSSDIRKKFHNTERYEAGIMMYLCGDTRTPEEALESDMQAKGYPVKIVDNRPRWTWTQEYPSCLQDCSLSLIISVAPEIFGHLPEDQKEPFPRHKNAWGFPGYNHGNAKLSSLCLADDVSCWASKSEEGMAMVDPFFLFHEDMIVDPIKARDILREIAQYTEFPLKRKVALAYSP